MATSCHPPTTVQIDGTSTLQFDGKWVSSIFYSHPRGYRLCLALKSAKIESPTKQCPIRKPNLQISLVALTQDDDDQRRFWPCKGTAIVRIQKHYSDPTALSDRVSVEFSIGEPISESDLPSNLPESLILWTPIPEECIPFRLKYNPPSPFDRSFFMASSVTSDFPATLYIHVEQISLQSEE